MSQDKIHEHHSENFKDFIREIEKTFEIRLRSNETRGIHTFGELTDLIIAKTNLRNQNISGKEHAFIGLREAISSTLNIGKEEIQMETKLITLFPRNSRRKDIRELGFEYGFDLKVLRPYLIIEAFFILSFFGAIVAFFFNFIYGLEASALLILLINIAFLTGKEFNVETVGDLAEKIMKLKNKNSRNNQVQFSDEEVMEELKFIFGEYLPSSSEITNETKII